MLIPNTARYKTGPPRKPPASRRGKGREERPHAGRVLRARQVKSGGLRLAVCNRRRVKAFVLRVVTLSSLHGGFPSNAVIFEILFLSELEIPFCCRKKHCHTGEI